MLDTAARRVLDRPLARTAAQLDRYSWLTANRLTLAGLALGVACAGAAALTWWPTALACWLLSRLADGLDGPLARRRAEPSARRGGSTSHAGGFLDISADFTVYGTTVVGVAVGVGGSPWPFVAVLLGYYLNGATFLAFSSIAERSGRTVDDGRSLSFITSLAEGTETIVVHALWLAFPGLAAGLATGWAVIVGISVLQRIWVGYHHLR